MITFPLQFQYELTRRQRLIPHLRIWRRYVLFITVSLTAGIWATLVISWWFLIGIALFLFIYRNLFAGFVNVLLVRLEPMDIIIEKNGLGFLAEGERYWIALDGLTAISEFAVDLWTVEHWNGVVIHIPKALLNEEYVAFLRQWVAKADAYRQKPGIKSPSRSSN